MHVQPEAMNEKVGWVIGEKKSQAHLTMIARPKVSPADLRPSRSLGCRKALGRRDDIQRSARQLQDTRTCSFVQLLFRRTRSSQGRVMCLKTTSIVTRHTPPSILNHPRCISHAYVSLCSDCQYSARKIAGYPIGLRLAMASSVWKPTDELWFGKCTSI